MGNKIKITTSSSAKLIAMIDLFAFVSILLLFAIYNNPTEKDLAQALELKTALTEENRILKAKLINIEEENQQLSGQIYQLKGQIRETERLNRKLALQHDLLVRKIIREYVRLFPSDRDVVERVRTNRQAISDLLEELNEHVAKLIKEKEVNLAKLKEDNAKLQAELLAVNAQVKTLTAQLEELGGIGNKLDGQQEHWVRIKSLIEQLERFKSKLAKERIHSQHLQSENQSLKKQLAGFKQSLGKGNFRTADISFSGGMFKPYPVDEPYDPMELENAVDKIIDQYEKTRKTFKYIFVIGHASVADAQTAEDRSNFARRARNWGYAGRRASVVANYLAKRLKERGIDEGMADNLVVIASTGEFDLRQPENPTAQENAWVEIVFCRDWKSYKDL